MSGPAQQTDAVIPASKPTVSEPLALSELLLVFVASNVFSEFG